MAPKKLAGSERSKEPKTAFKLFVGNLSESVDENMLRTAFAKYPSLGAVDVVKGKGYGFVTFGSPDEYLAAFRAMNGQTVGAKPITLKRATSQKGTPKARR